MGRRILALVGILFGLALFCIVYFVWPPDVSSGKARIIAKKVDTNVGVISVLQWWNGIDFYSTVVLVRPVGTTNWFVSTFSGDDRKKWKADISIQFQERVIIVKSGLSEKRFMMPLSKGVQDHIQFQEIGDEYRSLLDSKIPGGLKALEM